MVVVKNLTKVIKFKKEEKLLLKKINLQCPKKGLVLLYGKSGCGKTTLLNILEGLDLKYSGTVEIFGNNLQKINKKKYLKTDISIIFQESNFLNNYTVRENIDLIFNAKNQSYDLTLIEVKLKKFKIENILDKKIEMLSGGEKQILLIIILQFLTSKIVFCDEPTGSIDEENEIIAVNLLKELSRDKLVFVVSHNVNLFKKYADIVFHMEEGEIID